MNIQTLLYRILYLLVSGSFKLHINLDVTHVECNLGDNAIVFCMHKLFHFTVAIYVSTFCIWKDVTSSLFQGMDAITWKPQIFDVIANENARYKGNE